MTLSSKLRRNIARIIPFGMIWLVMSWVFLISDLTLTRSQNINPDTDITVTPGIYIRYFSDYYFWITDWGSRYGGKITLSIQATANQLTISVTDTGTRPSKWF